MENFMWTWDFWTFLSVHTLFSATWLGFFDAWHDQHVINGNKKGWHMADAFRMVVAVGYALILLQVTPGWGVVENSTMLWGLINLNPDTILAVMLILVLLYSFFIRLLVFDPLLYRFLGWPLKDEHTGELRGRNWLDQRPYWQRGLFLVVTLAAIIMWAFFFFQTL